MNAVFLRERTESRNGHLGCRLIYVPQQICPRVCYPDKALSGWPAGVHFPAGDGGEECQMSFSDLSC